MWVKPSTSTNNQTLFYYGGDDLANEGRIELSQFSGNNLLFRYGHTSDYIVLFGVGNFPTGQWNHILLTYDGGTTGSVAGDAAAYVGRFSLSINGANGISQLQMGNGGYSGSINPDNFRVGRLDGATTSSYLLDGIVNQVSIWGTDESANLATIYNSGVAHDMSALASPPLHNYDIEASITTVVDDIGSANLTGYNFTSSDLVSDIPN